MQLTTNTQSFVEATQYSNFILGNLHDGLLPETFYRNVSDFLHGSTLNIKTIGTVTIQDTAENTALVYTPIESGNITFQITEFKGNAWYVTDVLREDGNQVEALSAAWAVEATRAMQEVFETDFLAQAAAPFIAASGPENINGFPHFIVSGESNDVFALSHLVQMRLSFDKANVPTQGRVGIVDPVVEATLNGLVTITSTVTPFAENILRNGLAGGMQFFGEWMGWVLIKSNRLAIDASATDGSNTIASAIMNLFMCVLDDQTKPVMGAWRRMPRVEGERNAKLGRDEFIQSARYGFGIQRRDTLGCVATHQTNIS